MPHVEYWHMLSHMFVVVSARNQVRILVFEPIVPVEIKFNIILGLNMSRMRTSQ